MAWHVGPAGVRDPGIGARGLPRNLGDPAAPSRNNWRGAARPESSRPAGRRRICRERRKQAHGNGTANRRTKKGGRTVRRGSERRVAPAKGGNAPNGDLVEGRGRGVRESLEGNMKETPSSKIVCTRLQRIAVPALCRCGESVT